MYHIFSELSKQAFQALQGEGNVYTVCKKVKNP